MNKPILTFTFGLICTLANANATQVTVHDQNFYPKDYPAMMKRIEQRFLVEADRKCPDSEIITVENPKVSFSRKPFSGRSTALFGTIRRTGKGLSPTWFHEAFVSMTATIRCK